MIDWLDETSFPTFPPTSAALQDPNGLLAAGGLVSPLWLDQAYQRGIFPWNDPAEVRLWWSPAPRAIIEPSTFRIARSVGKALRRQDYRITVNQAFERVMANCARPRDYESGTWISDEMIDGYTRLHESGRALSFEYWSLDGQLQGGLYGLIRGRAFFGESMFSLTSNASKITFAYAAQALFRAGITLIDCQMKTDHLARFGLTEVSRTEYEAKLYKATHSACQIELPGVLP